MPPVELNDDGEPVVWGDGLVGPNVVDLPEPPSLDDDEKAVWSDGWVVAAENESVRNTLP